MSLTIRIAAGEPSLATPAEVSATCLDCGAPRLGAFCHACGQYHHDGPLHMRAIARDFLQRKLSLEGGLVRTFVDLSLRPGRVIRGYWEGQRQRYTNPVGYMLLSTGVYGWILPMWERRYRSEMVASAGAEDLAAEALTDSMVWMMEQTLALSLIVCLFFVVALRWVTRRSITTAESFVFALFVFAHANLMGALATPLMLGFGVSLAVTDRITALLLVVILVLAADGAFDGRLTAILRVLAASAIAVTGMIVVMFIVTAFMLAISAPLPV